MRGIIGRESNARNPEAEKLVFFCSWEQNTRAFGSNPVLLCYFPKDDTIELRQAPRGSKPGEVFAHMKAGCLNAPIVAKRQRVAKCVPLPNVCRSCRTSQAGQVLRSNEHACRPYFTSATKSTAGGTRPCRPAEGFFHWTDLALGKPLLICGMALQIIDADAAARAHFEKQGQPISADSLDTNIVNATLGRCAATLWLLECLPP